MWLIHMETGAKRVEEARASIVVAGVGVGGVLRGSSDVLRGANVDMFERQECTASVGVTPLIAPLVAIQRDYTPQNEALSYSAE